MFSLSRHTLLRQAGSHLRPASTPIAVISLSSLSRLLSTLVLLEQQEGKLLPASLNAVSAAAKLGGSVTALAAGNGAKSVAGEVAKVKGVEKVLVVENSAYDKVENISEHGCTTRANQLKITLHRVWQRITLL
jgi:electron transfer flavoprotein alpha subunit